MLARRILGVPPLLEMRRELERVFENAFGNEAVPMRTRPFPALNAWEDGDRMMVEAEIPGLGMEDLELMIQGDELTIKGRRPPMQGENLTYHRRERGTGEFARFVTLPVEVDAERVEAAIKDGVLTIVLPKAERAKARKIAVKSA